MAEITFIGLGNMGLPMAMNLLKNGHSVTGFDLAEDQVKILTNAGGKSTSDINKTIQTSDAVITMLPSGKIVKSIFFGDNGIINNAPKNLLLIDSSTIDVETAREVSKEAISKNLRIVDAPVDGSFVTQTSPALPPSLSSTSPSKVTLDLNLKVDPIVTRPWVYVPYGIVL